MIRYFGTWECPVQGGQLVLPGPLNHGDETLYCRQITVGGKNGMAVAPNAAEILGGAGPVFAAKLQDGRLPLPGAFAPVAGPRADVIGMGKHFEVFFDSLPRDLHQAFTADLHMHPLGHRYYGQGADLSGVVLHEADKRSIRAVVDWCVGERRLDIIAITDHDMIQPALYARDYARQAGLPVKVVVGAECEVVDPAGGGRMQLVHLLCLGLDELPSYSWQTTVPEMIRMVKGMGGVVIMSHPVFYPESFERYAHLLNGYEYRNGCARPFEEGKAFVRRRALPALPFCHSDFHYSGALPPPDDERLQHSRLTANTLAALGIPV